MTPNPLSEVTFLGPQSFDEMDIPPIMYKYRDWENNLHRRILKEREIYFAPPSSFSDPIDCHIPRRYDLLTDEMILNKYRNDLRRDKPTLTDAQVKKEAKEWFDKGLLRDENRIKTLENEFWNEFDRMFGVLSLTPIPYSKEMWIRYAADYSGFCVGFKSILLFLDSQHFGAGGPVSYYHELPTLIPYQEDPIIEHQRQIYSKEGKWSFEKEYRLSKFNIRNRTVTVPLDVYSEVIIGPKILKNYRKDIIRIVSKRLPGVVLKEMYFHGEDIKIRNI